METVKFYIPAINCGHCIHTIESEIGEMDGINRVQANLASKTVEIDFAPPATREAIIAALNELNYPPESGA